MKIASVADVKGSFSAFVKATEQGPVVITRNGKAVAAMIPLESDEDIERLLLGYSPRLRSILAIAKRRISAGQGIAHDDFWKRAAAQSRGRNARARRTA